MAFWTYIDVSSELASGMNIIWGNHLSITLIKDKSNPNIILGICFPQAYKDKVDGLNGNDIYISARDSSQAVLNSSQLFGIKGLSDVPVPVIIFLQLLLV